MSSPVLTHGAITDVHSTRKYDIGTRRSDKHGNVFVYLQGIASTVVGDFVTYYITSITAAVTTRLVANAKGLVAIAMAVTEVGKYGWYQIAGNNLYAKMTSGGNCAAGAAIYHQATGLVDDVKVTGDLIVGAVCSVQEGELSANPAGFGGVTLNYPSVNDVIPTA